MIGKNDGGFRPPDIEQYHKYCSILLDSRISGATGYIEKLINPETFVAEIIQYLSKSQTDQDTQQ